MAAAIGRTGRRKTGMRKREIEKMLERAVAEALGVELRPASRKHQIIHLTKKPAPSDHGRRAAA
jgi:hypothetical protein